MALVRLDNWQQRMSEDMRLVDYRPRTQEAYALAMRLFFEHVGREPALLTEEEVRRYFLYLRDERQLSPSYLNIAVCAMRFFFLRTMRVEWEVFDLLRVQRGKSLPMVLAIAEVWRVLGVIREPVRRMALTTIYALGLRLGEGLRLEVGQLDGERLQVRIAMGKNKKDRMIPLPRPLLLRLSPLLESRAPGIGDEAPVPACARRQTLRRVDAAEDLHRGCGRRAAAKARHHPHSAPQLRHAPARGRRLGAHRAGDPRARLAAHHRGVPARDHRQRGACPGRGRPPHEGAPRLWRHTGGARAQHAVGPRCR